MDPYYQKAKQKFQLEELEQNALETKACEKIRQEEIERKRIEEANRIMEKRLRIEQEVKKEEDRKLQVKLNEIKGKNPWDSGFL